MRTTIIAATLAWALCGTGALSGTVAFAQPPANAPQAAAPAPPAPVKPPAAGAPANGLPDTPGRAIWEKTYDAARQRARDQGKVVFVEFTRKKCGACFRMDGLLYPSVNFEMALLRMVPVKLDLEAGDAARIASRYGIHDAPAVLVVSAGGAMIFRMEGFDNDRAFYTHLHNSMTDWDHVNLRLVHEPETIGDPKSELELGAELFRRFDSEEAIPRLERAASPKSPAPIREAALAYLASAQMDQEHFAEAGATIDTLLNVAKNPEWREKAELFRAQLDLAQGKREQARRAFQTFLDRHPSSKHRDEAKSYLDRMGATEQPKS